jgi:O-antigen biosynthesis protein
MISVIIPTCIGGFNYLTKLMPQLSLEAKDHEIIIADNASRDGTTNYLSNYACTIIVNKTNEGFAKANNKAAKIAQGDYLLFLNNDTIVLPHFMEKMLNTFSLDPKTAIVGCMIIKQDTNRIQHAGVMFTQDLIPYELGLPVDGISLGISRADPRANTVREVPSVTAACMMIRKSVFQEVGGFDERYVNGWEDTDLVLKVREKGYKVWYNGTAVIYHKHFGSVNFGRLQHENDNRRLYDSIWVTTGRAKEALKGFLEG